MEPVLIKLPRCVLRTYRPEDAPSLAKHANNRKIWLGLRDAFPTLTPWRTASASSRGRWR